MKKIMFTAKNLKLGGIEKALVMITNYLSEQGNDVTIVLEEKEGELLDELNNKIKIEEHKPSRNKVRIIRKIQNAIKRIEAIFKYKNKYDISVSFATYSIPGSFVARIASKNSILWGHADYYKLCGNNEFKMKKFFSRLKYNKFSKFVFVAQSAKKSFLKVFPEKKDCTYYCNNLIDSEKIKKLSQETIELRKDIDITFLNLGRHDETQKKLTRIIEASKKLKEKGYKFKVIFVGEGESTDLYKKMVDNYGLKDFILFEGAKKNPYPYFNICDCVVLSSEYEGYPVVYLESFIFNKPIITTKVSDYEDIEDGRGIVCDTTTQGVYEAMKDFLEKGYNVTKQFDCDEYNRSIEDKLQEIIFKA